MEKVTIQAYHRTITVDVDQVKLHIKKDAAISAIMKLQTIYPNLSSEDKIIFDKYIIEQMKIIHSANRKIRKNVIVH